MQKFLINVAKIWNIFSLALVVGSTLSLLCKFFILFGPMQLILLIVVSMLGGSFVMGMLLKTLESLRLARKCIHAYQSINFTQKLCYSVLQRFSDWRIPQHICRSCKYMDIHMGMEFPWDHLTLSGVDGYGFQSTPFQSRAIKCYCKNEMKYPTITDFVLLVPFFMFNSIAKIELFKENIYLLRWRNYFGKHFLSKGYQFEREYFPNKYPNIIDPNGEIHDPDSSPFITFREASLDGTLTDVSDPTYTLNKHVLYIIDDPGTTTITNTRGHYVYKFCWSYLFSINKGTNISNSKLTYKYGYDVEDRSEGSLVFLSEEYHNCKIIPDFLPTKNPNYKK